MPVSEFSDVFVSYRRLDVEFVKRLVEDLQKEGKEVWVDWEDIPPGVVGFADEIKRGLEGADTFIAVLSPDYLESSYCVDLELAYAVELNKKIIPVVLHKFDDHEIPSSIGHINWIYFTPHAGQQNTYEEAFPKILEVMHTDLEHVKQHKRFLLRAIEWDGGNRHQSFLLNGEEIEIAQAWLRQAAGKEPIPTDLHQAYISASVNFRKRQQRLLFSGISTALVVSILLTVLSTFLFFEASTNADIALTAQANAEDSADVAQTAQANAEESADIAQTAQANAEANEAIAKQAQDESERNLQDARQSQALFHGDLAQQQAELGLYQRALLLGLEALKFHGAGITSDSAYQAVHAVLHQPIQQVLQLAFPQGIKRTINHDTLPQTLIITDTADFVTCLPDQDCSQRVEIWDIVTQEQVTYLPHTAAIATVIWYQEQEQLLTLEFDRDIPESTIRLWSTADSSMLYELPYDKAVLWMWEAGADHFVTLEQNVTVCIDNEVNCERQINVYQTDTGEQIASVPTTVNVAEVHVSQDQQYLSIISNEGFQQSAEVYDVATGELLLAFDATEQNNSIFWRDDDSRVIGQFNDAVISQDLSTGDILYSISATGDYQVDGDFIVFDVADTTKICDACNEFDVYSSVTGAFLFSTIHDRNQVEFVTMAQDGQYMITRTVDNRTCVDCETAYYVWGTDNGILLHTFDYDGWIENGIGGDALNPNERLLLVYSLNFVDHVIIELWDIATGQSRTLIDMDRDTVFDVHFDDSGQHIIVNQGDFFVLYDVASGLSQHTLGHTQFVDGITVLRDHLLVTTHTRTRFNVWDVVGWSTTLRNPGEIQIAGEAYNKNRDRLVTWSGVGDSDESGNNAYIWDTHSGQLLLTLDTPAPVYDAVWSPNERRIVVTQRGGTCAECLDGVMVFDAETGELVTSYDTVSGFGTLSWVPDSRNLISDKTDQMTIIDIETGEVIFSSDEFIPALSEWNRDYTQFVDQNTTDNTANIINYPAGEVALSIPLSGIYYDFQWVADDNLIVVLVDSLTERATDLVAYDTSNGDEQYRIENVGILGASPSGDQILVFTDDNQIHLIAADTGEIAWTLPTLNEDWTDIIWSPDETKAVLAGFLAGRTQLFDMDAGELLINLNFSQYQWSPNSELLLSLDDNITPPIYRVYDLKADTIRQSFRTNYTVQSFGQVMHPVWTPDSREIVSRDGVWVMNFGELINRGELLRVRDLTELELEEFFIKAPPDKPDVRDDDDDDDDRDRDRGRDRDDD